MGMEVEVATNHLKIFPKVNRNGVPINWVSSGIPITKNKSMDLLEDLGKESIRNTMLKHESIFKQQVCELHRLYRIQKILMNEVDRQSRPNSVATTGDLSATKPGFWSNHSPPFREVSGSTTQLKEVDPLHPDGTSKGLAIDTRESFRFQRGIKLDLGSRESPGRSFSSMEEKPRCGVSLQQQQPPPCESEESDLDLTLGIGSGSSRQKARPRPCSNQELRPSFLSSGMQEEGIGGHDVNLTTEGVQQHTWLFQTLRLERR